MFFNCYEVHQNGEFINGVKWLAYIVLARFRLPQLPFLGLFMTVRCEIA